MGCFSLESQSFCQGGTTFWESSIEASFPIRKGPHGETTQDTSVVSVLQRSTNNLGWVP